MAGSENSDRAPSPRARNTHAARRTRHGGPPHLPALAHRPHGRLPEPPCPWQHGRARSSCGRRGRRSPSTWPASTVLSDGPESVSHGGPVLHSAEPVGNLATWSHGAAPNRLLTLDMTSPKKLSQRGYICTREPRPRYNRCINIGKTVIMTCPLHRRPQSSCIRL